MLHKPFPSLPYVTLAAVSLCLLASFSLTWALGESSSSEEFCGGLDPQVPFFSDAPGLAELFQTLEMNTSINRFFIETDKLREPHIREVLPGRAFQAIGYALGYPTIFITDNDNLIMIDAPESYSRSLAMLDDFRKIPAIGNKPFHTVIITIFHGDHQWGLLAFLEDPNNNGVLPKVIFHEDLPRETQFFNTFNGLKIPRIIRSYGIFLPEPWHTTDAGVKRFSIDPRPIPPLETEILHFDNDDAVVTTTVDGLELEFFQLHGFTADHIGFYVAAWDLVFAGDVYYESFPNIYTIRGEPARDGLAWSASVRKAASYNAEYLMLTHSLPLQGKELIDSRLNGWADGMQFVHDQTVRYMYKRWSPDKIVKNVALPKAQAEKIDLQEVYGIIETSVRSTYDYYVGWYTGEGEDLFPLDRETRNLRMIEMVGTEKLLSTASCALDEGDFRWALELASYVWRADKTNRMAQEIRTLAMIEHAERSLSILARHYLLSLLVEEWGLFNNPINGRNSMRTLHLDGIFKNLQVHVDAGKVEDTLTGPIEIYVKIDVAGFGPLPFHLRLRNSVFLYDMVTSVPTGSVTFHVTEAEFRSYVIDGVLAGTVDNGSQADVDFFFSFFDFVDEA